MWPVGKELNSYLAHPSYFSVFGLSLLKVRRDNLLFKFLPLHVIDQRVPLGLLQR